MPLPRHERDKVSIDSGARRGIKPPGDGAEELLAVSADELEETDRLLGDGMDEGAVAGPQRGLEVRDDSGRVLGEA